MSTTKQLVRQASLAAFAGAATYAVTQWSRMATWGASADEVAGEMPGDELVGEARYRTTHAVTIDAPEAEVWAWLVQLGQGRGGMYSYDWLENLVGLDMHSAERIDPSLQDLAVGDVVRMVPEGTEPELTFTVLRLEAPRLLVLGSDGAREDVIASGMPYPAWTFELRPLSEARTRLVVRFQSDFKPTLASWLANKYALEPVHFLMERKMLLVLKERAERGTQAGRTGLAPGPELGQQLGQGVEVGTDGPPLRLLHERVPEPPEQAPES